MDQKPNRPPMVGRAPAAPSPATAASAGPVEGHKEPPHLFVVPVSPCRHTVEVPRGWTLRRGALVDVWTGFPACPRIVGEVISVPAAPIEFGVRFAAWAIGPQAWLAVQSRGVIWVPHE